MGMTNFHPQNVYAVQVPTAFHRTYQDVNENTHQCIANIISSAVDVDVETSTIRELASVEHCRDDCCCQIGTGCHVWHSTEDVQRLAAVKELYTCQFLPNAP